MSTQINVSVALESLRKLSQAQINANRQAQLLQVQRQGQAQKAVDTQQQGQQAQGRNLRGQLLYGIKSDRQRPQPEPFAAYRTATGTGWLLIPSDASFNAIVGGISSFAFGYLPAVDPPIYTGLMQYASADGPSGTGALFPSTAGYTPELGESIVYTSELLADSGIRTEPAGQAFTFEMMVKLGQPSVNAYVRGENSYVFADIAYEKVVLAMLVESPTDPGLDGDCVFTASYGDAQAGTSRNFTAHSQEGFANVIPSLANFADYQHVAIVQEPGSTTATRTVSVYHAGTRRVQWVDIPADDLVDWSAVPPDWGRDVAVEARYGNFDGGVAGTVDILPTKVHGIRFTPRALYTGATYTPPTSITSLA